MKIFKTALVLLLVMFAFACNGPMVDTYSAWQNEDGVYTGYIRGENWSQEITYQRINGVNIYEGDIAVLDEDIYATPDAVSRGIVTDARLWANNTVHYEIASNVYDRNAILSAFQHIEANSNVQFVPHGPSNPTGNYLYFKPDSGSWSYIGCLGQGKQDLALASWADTGVAVHEMLHALGVYHEQSRQDRDQYLTIHWSNIESGMEGNFNMANGARDSDIGYFDFTSIMLYGPTAFSKNGQATITKKDGSTYTTQRDHMSSQDILGVNYLYGGGTTDTQAPTVPGQPAKTGSSTTTISVQWAASTDNVGVTGYKVYVDNVHNTTVSYTSATISGLSPNTYYSISVSAIDAAGNESGRSTALSAKTDGGGSDTQAPTVPTYLNVTSVTSSSVSLSWTASTDNVGVTGYKVYADNVYKTTVTSTSATVSGLAADTTYSFTVSAVDAAGNESAKSTAKTGKTDPGTGGDAWAAYTNYQTGDIVTHLGSTYRCIQGHMSLPGWEPNIVPALWSKQ